MKGRVNNSLSQPIDPTRPRNTSPKRASALRRMRYKLSETWVRRPVSWLRHRDFKPADVVLGCYPRSGSTWLRFTLFEILTGQPSEFESVNRAFRKLSQHAQGLPVLPERGRVIGTHEAYRSEYKRAFYLMRDVRDVALSEFAYEKARGVGSEDFDEYLRRLLEGRKKYGSWQNHVSSWLDSGLADSGNLLIIRFEDIRRDTEQTVAQILDFLRIPVDRARIRNAVLHNSLERMRAKEDACGQAQVEFPRRPHKSSSEEHRFVRSGSIEGWRQKLTEAQVQVIERYAGNVLARMGYPVTTQAGLQTARDEFMPRVSATLY